MVEGGIRVVEVEAEAEVGVEVEVEVGVKVEVEVEVSGEVVRVCACPLDKSTVFED